MLAYQRPFQRRSNNIAVQCRIDNAAVNADGREIRPDQ
jgi:hypothetical protein